MISEKLQSVLEHEIKMTPTDFINFKKESLDSLKNLEQTPEEKESYRLTPIFNFLEVTRSPSDEKIALNPSATAFSGGKLLYYPTIPGVNFYKLKDKWNEVKEIIAKGDRISSLHHALLTDGIYIEISKGTTLDHPLKLVHLFNELNIASTLVIIDIKENANLAIYDEHIISTQYLSELYIKVGKNSRLEHIHVENSHELSFHLHSTQVELSKDANYQHTFFHLNGDLIRKNHTINLNESGAHAELSGLYLTNKKEHSDIHTTINHKVADTTSKQITKGILSDDSKAIFTGKIHIHKLAQRVNSGQLTKNLLLSNKAQAHSCPQLEIFADDVKCSHGSTTGQLSSDEIFYFKARGIPEEKARTLLSFAFGNEIVEKINNLESKASISNLVMNTLRDKFKIG